METHLTNKTPVDTVWHAMTADDAVSRLATDSTRGLPATEASDRLAQHGPNRLPAGKPRGALMRFLSQLNNVLVYVLLGAGFTKLMLGLWVDAAIILGVKAKREGAVGLGMAGISGPWGFYLLADLPSETVCDAALEALKRLQEGEASLDGEVAVA